MTPEILPVIFRRDRGKHGEVTAVFPTLPYSAQGLYWTCYAHMGQHGSCGIDWLRRTRPATPEEYAPLLRELQGIYERGGTNRLEPCRKMTPAHKKAFDALVAMWRSERN